MSSNSFHLMALCLLEFWNRRLTVSFCPKKQFPRNNLFSDKCCHYKFPSMCLLIIQKCFEKESLGLPNRKYLRSQFPHIWQISTRGVVEFLSLIRGLSSWVSRTLARKVPIRPNSTAHIFSVRFAQFLPTAECKTIEESSER